MALDEEALIQETLARLLPVINQAVQSAVNAALERVRVTKFIGGTVVTNAGDTVQVAPDDDPSILVEATSLSASQVAGARVLLGFSGEAGGAVYAFGVIPT